MAIPELVRRGALEKVEAYCERKVPMRARHQVRAEAIVRGDAITIFERRAPWRPDDNREWTRRKIARFLYDPPGGCWSLWWADRNGRWLAYPPSTPTLDIETLISEIEQDRSGAFWG
jgi:hypothetical protein